MAFDGIAVAALVKELNDKLRGGVISRVVQPEKDELLLTVKQYKDTYRLFISASASLPLLYLTEQNKNAPITAPAFCMLLRKHLQNGRIVEITQPGLERVICIAVEHRDEMGDLAIRKLMVEIMGKYSNAILTMDDGTIIDAIKRVPSSMSSVREVLTGRPYFIPETTGKTDPMVYALRGVEDMHTDSLERALSFLQLLKEKNTNIAKALANTFTGISFISAEEFCCEAGIDGGAGTGELDEKAFAELYKVFCARMTAVKEGIFNPVIVYKNGEPVEFSAFPLKLYGDVSEEKGADGQIAFSSMSEVLVRYYSEKNKHTLMRQKSASLRQIVTTTLGRASRKLELQQKQMTDTEKMEQYRVYGELLQAFGYGCEEGAKSITVTNYYTNEPMTIPLKPELTAQENSQRYFERYNKLKRTRAQLTGQIEETQREIEQLDSVLTSLDIAENEADLSQIRKELAEGGFVKAERNAAGGRKGASRTEKTEPLHYVSSDGYDLYVGKNNYQNEYVTFHVAGPDDLWFHSKGVPGSHVIAKTGGKSLNELPDRLFEEAGSLAAYYSKGKVNPKVEIDYTIRRNLKRPNAGAPGFVIYHTNYSLVAEPDISGLQRV